MTLFIEATELSVLAIAFVISLFSTGAAVLSDPIILNVKS